MRNTPMRLGLLALLLSVIAICLSTLAVLSVASSSADMRLAERFADSVSTRYELEEEGQRYLQEMNRNVSEDEVSKEFSRNGFTLSVTLQKNEDRYEIKLWKIKKQWEESTKIDNLWKGE